MKNAEGSSTVLNDPEDRFAINFDLTESSDKPNLLSEGDEVTIKTNTMSGATASIRLTVPESLGRRKASNCKPAAPNATTLFITRH